MLDPGTALLFEPSAAVFFKHHPPVVELHDQATGAGVVCGIHDGFGGRWWAAISIRARQTRAKRPVKKEA